MVSRGLGERVRREGGGRGAYAEMVGDRVARMRVRMGMIGFMVDGGWRVLWCKEDRG